MVNKAIKTEHHFEKKMNIYRLIKSMLFILPIFVYLGCMCDLALKNTVIESIYVFGTDKARSALLKNKKAYR